ncbi:hypothetical protein PILCRDRAFT_829916 [Piloderma croceum F 1598]|uniref:Nudix hydrolase domain-containing protein n=1 Tax=Piloderma croceum (strain F 1598) TaxID=765440 RepID=A0A0C3EW51_PILCF|nr:hypothetical protein PILCRDRAFT_829916 [Piloderma croceum F 1598]
MKSSLLHVECVSFWHRLIHSRSAYYPATNLRRDSSRHFNRFRAACQSHMPTLTETAKPSPVPRPSASLVVVNSRNEVLLVHRNPQATSFGGVHVFPGGNFDTKQDSSLQMTAIRETFEESGLLIASSSDSSRLHDYVLDEARKSIHAQRTNFETFLTEHHLTADVSSLLPFTTWVTPQSAPRRFRAQFYVIFLPASSSTGFSSGDKSERVPTHDGGQEIMSARFLHPTTAIQAFREDKLSFMPPQYYILSTLCDILEGNENTILQRGKIEMLSRGAFGRMVINPVMLPERDAQGRQILAYEGDEARGGPKGRIHRALGIPGKSGFKGLVLMRNFDIFSEVATLVPGESTKL